MIKRIVVFLVLNFAALALGGFFTSDGVISDWYMTLHKAPWTPPGWFFGFAWTTIMICFSIYMAYLWSDTGLRKSILGLYIVQWILNVIWNPLFFYFHSVGIAMIVIVLLTCLIGYIMFKYWSFLKEKSLLILPYFIWLLIATSLNAYILFKN